MGIERNQHQAPFVSALRAAAGLDHAAFYAPGHKLGQGGPEMLRSWWGQAIFQADLPELPSLDNLFAPSGPIAQAQTLAARLFGADRTWFLVNGSSAGLMAAVLATCSQGEEIIVPRNIHRSVISGLILSGAQPVFVQPEYDADWDLVLGVTPDRIAQALAQHPQAKAVLVVSPTYQGICSDLATIAKIVHRHGLPLLVDEAHGAHFQFHPALPSPALALGADLVVQSSHKVLSALSQAAMLHLRGDRIDGARIDQMLQLLQSTSPNALLLASLDATRQQMAQQGTTLWQHLVTLAQQARLQLQSLPGVQVFGPPQTSRSGCDAIDVTRLVVRVSDLGYTGFEADAYLSEQRVICELPMLRHLTFILTIGNTAADIQRLVDALARLCTLAQPIRSASLQLEPCEFGPQGAGQSPRQAFFAASEMIPWPAAIGRISAELVCPYPPGIPALMPGEVIQAATVNYLHRVMAAGGIVTGCSDPQLHCLRVVSSSGQ